MRQVISLFLKPAKSSSIPAKVLHWFLKIAISVAAIVYVVYKLQLEGKKSWEALFLLEGTDFIWILLSFALIALNFGLEALKWQRLIAHHYPNISLQTSLKAILAGNTTGIFTPNRVGEYAGRVLYLPEGKRWEAALLTFVDRICQMIITIWMGGVAFSYLVLYFKLEILKLLPITEAQLYWAIALLFAFNIVATLVVIFPHKLIEKWISADSAYLIFRKIRAAVENTSPSTFVNVLIISFLRNMTFSLQYYLLLIAFGYENTWTLGMVLIWGVFLIKSVIPSISLSELGIRESVAVAVMGVFAIPAGTAVGSTFLLYVFNIALPAIVGIFYVQKMNGGKN
jgi:uncharacterized membrane protein YbhN (UPF0104 family)